MIDYLGAVEEFPSRLLSPRAAGGGILSHGKIIVG